MWGALLAVSIAGWTHQLTATPGPGGQLLGHGVRDGQAMIATLRHKLIRVPAPNLPEPRPPERHSGPQPATNPQNCFETITHTRRRSTHRLLANSSQCDARVAELT